MNWLVVGALLPSLLVAWSAGYVVRWKAARWGFLDRPGGHKGHQRATPLGGGLAIWLAVVGVFAVGQLVLWGLDRGILSVDAMPTVVQTHWQGLLFRSAKLWTLLAAASVMMALGLVDDLRGLPWQLRLAVQVLVAVVVVCQGWRLALFLDLPWLTGLLSVLWIVGLTNTFNMLDNMDGLAAGVAAIAALVLAAVLLLACTAVAAPAADRPIVILIMTDDLGFADLGCYRSEIWTPALDTLAADGLRFTQFYNTAKCHSSRVSLLTGLYCDQAGSTKLSRGTTIAEVLSEAGYFTAMSGKWHPYIYPRIGE